jgi:hypothetical protein
MGEDRGRSAGRCWFEGKRTSCTGVPTVARGSIPLCDACEVASSSLKRLPLARLPRTVAGST